MSNYRLILANDDIIVHRFEELMSVISQSDFDILGVDLVHNPDKDISVDQVYEFPANSYGVFMYVKKYTYIPEQFKIWVWRQHII
jgi:hypothetical protein